MKRILAIIIVIGAIICSILGYTELKHADTWIEFARGMFWMFVGVAVFVGRIDEARGKS